VTVIPGRDEVASPESILTARLALGPFARIKRTKRAFFISRMRQAARAMVVMDSGLDVSHRPGMTVAVQAD